MTLDNEDSLYIYILESRVWRHVHDLYDSFSWAIFVQYLDPNQGLCSSLKTQIQFTCDLFRTEQNAGYSWVSFCDWKDNIHFMSISYFKLEKDSCTNLLLIPLYMFYTIKMLKSIHILENILYTNSHSLQQYRSPKHRSTSKN